MRKTVRVKVEFEINVVVDSDLLTSEVFASAEEELGGLSAVGKYLRTIPEATRHLALAETFTSKAVKELVVDGISDYGDADIKLKGFGNLKANVISEKK